MCCSLLRKCNFSPYCSELLIGQSSVTCDHTVSRRKSALSFSITCDSLDSNPRHSMRKTSFHLKCQHQDSPLALLEPNMALGVFSNPTAPSLSPALAGERAWSGGFRCGPQIGSTSVTWLRQKTSWVPLQPRWRSPGTGSGVWVLPSPQGCQGNADPRAAGSEIRVLEWTRPELTRFLVSCVTTAHHLDP